MGVESKRWEWMAGRKKIQGEAELSSFTNSACGVVLGTCLSFTDRTPCVGVTRVVVAQTFVELHCKLDKGVVGFGFGFFCFGLVFWTCEWVCLFKVRLPLIWYKVVVLGALPCTLDQPPQADLDSSLHSCPGAVHLAKSHDGKAALSFCNLTYFSCSSQELFKHLPYQKCYFYCAFTLGGDGCFALNAELLAMF